MNHVRHQLDRPAGLFFFNFWEYRLFSYLEVKKRSLANVIIMSLNPPQKMVAIIVERKKILSRFHPCFRKLWLGQLKSHAMLCIWEKGVVNPIY